MTQPVKLTRCYTHYRREYRIDATVIKVAYVERAWRLLWTGPDGAAWLNSHSLRRATFPTRAEALRAYQAAAAIAPAPPAPHNVKLRRVRAGIHQADDATVTRHPTKNLWLVEVDGNPAGHAVTLTDAADIITETRRRPRAWARS